MYVSYVYIHHIQGVNLKIISRNISRTSRDIKTQLEMNIGLIGGHRIAV